MDPQAAKFALLKLIQPLAAPSFSSFEVPPLSENRNGHRQLQSFSLLSERAASVSQVTTTKLSGCTNEGRGGPEAFRSQPSAFERRGLSDARVTG
jgi:hypothetical protein